MAAQRNTTGEMLAAFLFVVFSGTVSTSWRGWLQFIASWRWWPHGHCLQAEPVKLQGGSSVSPPPVRQLESRLSRAKLCSVIRHRVEILNQSEINNNRYFPRFDQEIN